MYLLDTHSIIWFLEGNSKLSKRAKRLIEEESENILVSCISIWELAIKISIGKLILEKTLLNLLQQLETLWKVDYLLKPELFIHIESLPFHKYKGLEHRDPFDRLLISHAQINKLQIISCDEKFDLYENLTRIW